MGKVGYKMDVTEIRNQRLSTILTNFMICQSCRIVDNDRERMRVGYECPRCGIPRKPGMIYFPSNVQSMIDLMQEFYHQEQKQSLASTVATDKSGENHRPALVVCRVDLAFWLVTLCVSLLLYLAPGIPQRHRPVEHKFSGRGIGIDAEVALPFELVPTSGLRVGKAGFNTARG